jgi:LIVCS family branched-chain amino acid:cation transporter
MSKNVVNTIIIGFALFASFFGAGNLIFPPAIGLAAGKQWGMALTGFTISGVILPILAFVAIVRTGGTEEGIVSEMGRGFSLFFITVVMLCTSLLIAIPRTAAVTHSLGLETIFGPFPQIVTSCVYFVLVYYVALNPSTVVEKVGKYLTPILLLIMLVIVIKGILSPLGVPVNTGTYSAMRTGFIDGYQTLDVFGGLVFSGAVFAAVVALQPDKSMQIKMAYGCALVAGLGLFVIYGGLIYLGATGSGMFAKDMSNTDLLIALIDALFKGSGPMALAFAAIFACITTAISLAAGASYFFSRVTNGQLSYKFNVAMICIVSLLISTLGIEKIIRYAVPILVFIYPTAIVMVLLNVFRFNFINKGTFLGAGYCTLLIGFFEMLEAAGLSQGFIAYITPAIGLFPYAEHGFAWAAPALASGIIGTIYYNNLKRKENASRVE